MEFDGVGPKTASCVLLFCLRRDSFAVDTHVVWDPAIKSDLVSNNKGPGMGATEGES